MSKKYTVIYDVIDR